MRHRGLGGLIPRLPVLLLIAACSSDTTAARPACDAAEVLGSVRAFADTHPGYQPRLPARSAGIEDVRETRQREAPEQGAGAFERLCTGTLVLENGDRVETGWQIATSRSIFGPVWTMTPCFGPYDPAGADCSAYARGHLPGEAH